MSANLVLVYRVRSRTSAVSLPTCNSTACLGRSWAVRTHLQEYDPETFSSLSLFHFLDGIIYLSVYFNSQLLKMGYVMGKHNTDFEGFQNPESLSWVSLRVSLRTATVRWSLLPHFNRVLNSNSCFFPVTSCEEPTKNLQKDDLSPFLLYQLISLTAYIWSKNLLCTRPEITKDITDNTGNKVLQASL